MGLIQKLIKRTKMCQISSQMPCNLCLSDQCAEAEHERMVNNYVHQQQCGILTEHFTCTVCLALTFLPYSTDQPFYICVCYSCIHTPIPSAIYCPSPKTFLANRGVSAFVKEMMKRLWNVVPSKGYPFEIVDKRPPRFLGGTRFEKICQDFVNFRHGFLFTVDHQHREIRVGNRMFDFRQISPHYRRLYSHHLLGERDTPSRNDRAFANQNYPPPQNFHNLDIVLPRNPILRPEVILVSESETDELASVGLGEAVDELNTFLDRLQEEDE